MILKWLNKACENYADKTCYRDNRSVLSFAELKKLSDTIGSFVSKESQPGNPIAIMTSRCVTTPAIYLGIAAAGCFYAPMDGDMPKQRLGQIMDVVRPEILITDGEHLEKAKGIINAWNNVRSENCEGDLGAKENQAARECKIVLAEDFVTIDNGRISIDNEKHPIDRALLDERDSYINEDTPLYCIFTSGSSGVPKGVLTSHEAVCCYLDGLNKVIDLDENDVIGGQAPLDYIAAIRDIYLPLMTGCETVFIPKNTFAMPEELFGVLNKHKVTTICWSATGVEIPARLGAFEVIKPEYLKRVVFSGSVISSKLLSVWQSNLPDVMFVNQYGPTEATGSCTYYVINEKVRDDTVLPIGKPYEHYEVFILDNEICVAGPALALEYYGAPELTEKSFPVTEISCQPKRIYRTGDIGAYNENGDLMFLGRKDRQIKHMGHRVELEEIEHTAGQIEGVSECASLYDAEVKLIYLFYSGAATAKDITIFFRSNMPAFMVPRKIVQLDEMPHLRNGKIDMQELKTMM